MSVPGSQPPIQAAWQMFAHLASGHAPHPVLSSLRLDGQVLMDENVQISIYAPDDVEYKVYNTSIFGMLSDVSLLESLAFSTFNRWRNSKSRLRATNQAAPQWRPIGTARVVITDLSIWTPENGVWNLWIPHDAVAQMLIDPHGGMAEISGRQMPPVRFHGPAAARAGILIAYFVYAGEFATVPGLESFVAAMNHYRD